MAQTWGQLGNRLIQSAMKSRIPVSGQFELTARCNLRCKMCYVCRPAGDSAAVRQEKTAKEWISMAEQARDAGMLYLLLTGGEVFLRKDFLTIYTEVAKMGFHIEIYTNATLINKEIARSLGKIPPSKMGITIYGASPETYGTVCGNAGAYDMSMRGIQLLQEEGITLWLKTTVIKDNIHDFERIWEIAERQDIYFDWISYVSPRRENGHTCPEDVRLSPSELCSFLVRAANLLSIKQIRNENSVKHEDHTCNLDVRHKTDDITPSENIMIHNPNSAPKNAFRCTAGKCSFWITWDGRMTPCTFMDEPYTNPFDIGFTNAWAEVQNLCNAVPICTECEECRYQKECVPCPARLWIETGVYHKPAPYLCNLMQTQYEKKEVLAR